MARPSARRHREVSERKNDKSSVTRGPPLSDAAESVLLVEEIFDGKSAVGPFGQPAKAQQVDMRV